MKHSYNERKDTKFRSDNTKTFHYGTETLSYIGPETLNINESL